MWPFAGGNQKQPNNDGDESEYTEEEYEEEYEYEVEVTDDEYESDEEEKDGVLVELPTKEEEESLLQEDGEETQSVVKEELVEEEEHSEVGEEPEEEEEYETEEEHEGLELEQVPDHEESEAEEDGYSQKTTDDENDDDDEEEEEDGPTSLEEKKGLLALAAEHDRVDIIQSIFTDEQEDRQELLHGGLPPLHIAVSFGSTNTTSCLLRMGADPSVRPEGLEEQHKKYNGMTAWELAFGTPTNGDESSNQGGWFGGSPRSSKVVADIAPSKREGIRHAFTAEALRCIGADEVERLIQLLGSGMPKDTEIGGKNIAGWCKEMGATKCLEAIAPAVAEKEGPATGPQTPTDAPMSPSPSKTLVQPPVEPPSPTLIRRLSSDYNDADSLLTRLEEIDELSRGLSNYLDNLAEEVSVCHGLLLMGNGASALAAHVRSLNDQQDFLQRDLKERNSSWQYSEEELEVWKARCSSGDLVMPQQLPSLMRKQGSFSNDPMQLRAQLAASENKIRKLRASIEDMAEESESAMKEVERRGLTGGIKLVRKLREEIRALEFQVSEAKSGDAMCRAMIQKLQQQWKEQKANEAKTHESAQPPPQTVASGEAMVEEEVDMFATPVVRKNRKALNTLIEEDDTLACDPLALEPKGNDEPSSKRKEETSLQENGQANGQATSEGSSLSNSNKITSGHSEALMKYDKNTNSYMPVDLWKLLLRIIGLGRVAVHQNVADLKKQATTTVMIV